MNCKICHNEIGDSSVCPFCAYNKETEGAPKPEALLPGMSIGKRYIISGIVSSTESEITYSAWDLKERSSVTVKEFFPRAHVSRQPDGSLAAVSADSAEKYSIEFEKFADLYEKQVSENKDGNFVTIDENYTVYLIAGNTPKKAPADNVPSPEPKAEAKEESITKVAAAPHKETATPHKETTVTQKETAASPKETAAPVKAERPFKKPSKAPVIILSVLLILALLAALAFAFLYFGGDEMLGFGDDSYDKPNNSNEDEDKNTADEENKETDSIESDTAEDSEIEKNEDNYESSDSAYEEDFPSTENQYIDSVGAGGYDNGKMFLIFDSNRIVKEASNQSTSRNFSSYSAIMLGNLSTITYTSSEASMKNFNADSRFYTEFELVVFNHESGNYDKSFDYGIAIEGDMVVNEEDKIINFSTAAIIPKNQYDGYNLTIDWIEVIKNSVENGEDYISLIKNHSIMTYKLKFVAFDSQGNVIENAVFY